MTASPLHSAGSQYGPYSAFVLNQDAAPGALEPGERVGGPVKRRKLPLVRLCLLVAVAGGGAYAWSEHRDQVSIFASQATALLQDLQARHLPPQQQKAEAPKLPEPLPLAAEREIAASSSPQEMPAVEAPISPVTPTDAEEPAAATPAPVERLPEVVADPKDALQQKALAAGLHPALSRALLDKLTAEDFRNAADAVRTALTRTVGDEPVVWPRRRASGQAQFRVKLVAGAPTECRRYVVQIAKDGWETTARPMERCGAIQASRPG